MTAEIAILNKMAVALAADSKVTIGSEGQEKTYDTVNKLFTLSRIHPVGIMVYGNADFMGFPWETIIKTYRRQKKEMCEPTVERWSEDFIEFSKRYYPFGKDDHNANVNSLMSATWAEVFDRVMLSIQEGDKRAYETILADAITQDKERALRAPEFLVGAGYADFLKKHDKQITDFVDQHIRDDALKPSLHEMLLLSLTRHRYSPTSSGIVIAGFGDEERLPAIFCYELDGFVGPQLKCRVRMSHTITRTPGEDAVVVPFAQREMVQRFMDGIDPLYRMFLEGSMRGVVKEVAVAVLDNYCDAHVDATTARSEVEALADKEFQKISKMAQEYRYENFSGPIVSMVTTLPKEELANMAEALVNLTSLKRRISKDRETVGGPIDVAVISKGDGFVWVKRKHYFDPRLNHHFVANYFRDMED